MHAADADRSDPGDDEDQAQHDRAYLRSELQVLEQRLPLPASRTLPGAARSTRWRKTLVAINSHRARAKDAPASGPVNNVCREFVEEIGR
jgi:hypothetical protein